MRDIHKITVYDRSPNGKPVHDITLTFRPSSVTLREIIADRVRMEADLYKQKVPSSLAKNLVQPANAEARLNGPAKDRRCIDVDKQIETALRAFEHNGFFVLVGDKQVKELDDRVSLSDSPRSRSSS